jgi:glutaminase
MFRSLDYDNDGWVSRTDFENVLAELGIAASDPRIAECIAALDEYRNAVVACSQDADPDIISEDALCAAMRPNILLLERVLQGDLVIPDFGGLREEFDQIYLRAYRRRGGNVADYIPQLNLTGPEADRLGAALCTVDGQRYSIGDARVFFSVQSSCKPLLYCLALEEHGATRVHEHVGHEPSGVAFNELTLDKLGRPHNPLINAGAIMCSSLIGLNELAEIQRRDGSTSLDTRGWAGRRLENAMSRWEAMCGGERPQFDGSIYLSERETADRNFALAYYMREKGTFPKSADLEDVLDFYFQSCSVELNAEMMSVAAATLASGGVCPTTGERVLSPETVRHCLSMMSSCGMYDFSGEFAFTIGLPAKSSVSGVIMTVIPGVMGVCVWSPRLDSLGNSVRGLEFCRGLVETFTFHNYDSPVSQSGKKDARAGRIEARASRVNELIWAASKGDLSAIQRKCQLGADIGAADYDRRTPLHLAAAEGQVEIVRFFAERHAAGDRGVDISPRDRWGGTPLDDAYFHGHPDIIEVLREAGGQRGEIRRIGDPRSDLAEVALGSDAGPTVELIWAASQGDISSIRRLVARGIDPKTGDYDHRTPLHLASAEGQSEVVAYLLAQGVEPNPRDRWGNTPLGDARRHGHGAVEDLLAESGATE